MKDSRSIKNINDNNYNRWARTSDLIFGWLVLLSTLIAGGMFALAAVLGLFISSISASQSLLGGTLFCMTWGVVGVKALVRAERAGRCAKLFGFYSRIKISEVSKELRKPLRIVSADLNSMKKRGYFNTIDFDLDNKEVVLLNGSSPLLQIGADAQTVYKERKGLPILPITATVVTAFAFSSFNLIAAGLLAVGAFMLTLKYFPSPIYFVEAHIACVKSKRPQLTGDGDLDSTLTAIFENKKELIRLSGSIVSEKIRVPLLEIIRLSDQISAYVTENPEKIKNLRQFAGYYLPTTVDFLHTYEELEAKPDKGENINATLLKIEETTANLVEVFRREYDDLFCDRAMDISAEASVMQAIIKENENLL
jgi:hypothetical protein